MTVISCQIAGPLDFLSKTFDRLVAAINDLKQLIQPCDLENLFNVGADRAQPQLASGGFDFLVHCDQFAEGGARQVFDVGKIEDDLLAVIVIDQAEQLISDDLNV